MLDMLNSNGLKPCCLLRLFKPINLKFHYAHFAIGEQKTDTRLSIRRPCLMCFVLGDLESAFLLEHCRDGLGDDFDVQPQ